MFAIVASKLAITLLVHPALKWPKWRKSEATAVHSFAFFQPSFHSLVVKSVHIGGAADI
jgi:hypothetical protein